MSHEKIRQPINNENIMAQEMELAQRIFIAQLYSVEKKIADNNIVDITYIDLFDKSTDIVESLFFRYYNQELKNTSNKEGEEFDKIKTKLTEEIRNNIIKISKETEGEERVKAIYDYTKSIYEKYPDVKEKSKDAVGLIYYNKVKAEDFGEDLNFNEGDDLFEMHFSSAFLQEKNIGLQELKDWFSQIAKLIIEKYPETKAVVGISWLFSHPIMKRLGFTITTEKDKPQIGSSYWNQLISKDGQIDLERFDFLLANGELPYKKAVGHISIEDFLIKYLPEENRGEVVLRKINKENFEMRTAIREQVERGFKNKLSETTDKQISVDDLLKEMPDFVKLVKDIGLEQEVKDFFQECLTKKLTIEMVRNDADLVGRFKPINDKIEAKYNQDSYLEYKIIIPKK